MDATDKQGNIISVGSLVRLLRLSGSWLDDLPLEERTDVLSMVGQIFEVEEIDEYGHPWVSKWWPSEHAENAHSHSIALNADEYELVS